jgi:Protein of unknown function (DUF2795)
MEQGANKHGPLTDDEMKAETSGMVRAGRSTRAEEWRDQEPSAEDQPDVDRAPDETLVGGTPDGMTAEDVGRRSELASYLDRSVFPADRGRLMDDAEANNAPDAILAELRRLPDGQEFANVQDVWAALGGGTEAHRF